MTVNQLIPGELAILGALEDQRPRNSVELAELIDLPGWACRSMAQGLVRRHLIARCTVRQYIGSWEITQAGLEHLAQMRQLKLVG